VKQRLLLALLLLTLVTLLAWVFRPQHEPLGFAYVSERNITLWSTVAQVREPLATLHYGDKVEVLNRRNENVKVRTAAGVAGWVDGRVLMEPGIWQRSIELLAQARAIPLQARGRTKVSTNLRIAPGRTAPRLYHFGRGVPVEIVGRSVAEREPAADEKEAPGEPQENKKEDWFLIRAMALGAPGDATTRAGMAVESQMSEQPVPIAGWAVARFVELDLPDAIREGITGANMRPLAWFELNRVPDPSGAKPQYLVAGAHGEEGQPCDITTLRVYTWSEKRSRYETAFIESDLCGALPIRLGKGPKGEPEFRFREMGGNEEERVYRLVQTVVRRVRESTGREKKPAHGAR
jgi:hypothetical protein